MADFRKVLYEHYGSTFKNESAHRDINSLSSYLEWCKHKVMPLLQGLRNDDQILELGCGAGDMLEFLTQAGYKKVKGIDVSVELVEIAVSRGSKAEVADVFSYLCDKEDKYDAIIAFDFIEHFTKEELMVLFPMIYRSLRKNGRLLVRTPNGAGLFPHQIIYGDLTHMTIFTPDSLQQTLSISGFHSFVFRETGPARKNIIGILRLLLWWMIKTFANIVRQIEAGKRQKYWTENMICCCRKFSNDCK